MTEIDYEKFASATASAVVEALASVKGERSEKNEKDKKGDKKDIDAHRYDKIADEVVMMLSERRKYPLYHKGQFYIYDGCKYIKEDELSGIIRIYLKTRKQPQSNNIVGNVKEIVQSRAQRLANQYGDLPFYAGDGEFPAPENIISYKNGLLDVAVYLKGNHTTLLPHTSKWYSTMCLPYNYDPAARCDRWLQLMDEVYEGRQYCIDILQEYFGLCLTCDMSFQKFLVLKGVSGAGKGTILHVLSHLVGNDNACGYDLNCLAHNFGLQMLLNKTLAIVGENELDKNGKRRAVQMLNSIVGQDSVPIDRKGMPALSVCLSTRFVVACNQMPAYADPCGALARRMLLLEHRGSFAHREDKELRGKLVLELSGINNWALEGLARLRRNGRFTDDPELIAVRNRYRRNNSPAFAFLQDCLIIERRLNPGDLDVEMSDGTLGVSGDLLRERWWRWCELNNLPDDKFAWMMQSIYDILPRLEAGKRRRIDGKQVYFYQGIGLKLAD